jgi:AbiV family abortive infection protein
MPQLSKLQVQSGACCALAHAAHLIEDATILYVANRISTSYALAILAREEYGRANLLWKRASSMGENEAIHSVALGEELQDHIAKLDAGQLTTSIKLTRDHIASWTQAIHAQDKVALAKLSAKRNALVAKVRKHDPSQYHKRRLKALYVDLNPDGTWSRPSETKKIDTQTLILIVASEIAGSLLEVPNDPSILAACAAVAQVLPTYSDIDTRVISHVLTISA